MLELLVVVGVLGIIVAIGTPSLLVQMRKVKLESAANDVANLIQQTRLRAIRDNKQYTISVAGGSVLGQGLIAPLELEVTDPPVRLFTGGADCPVDPTIDYDGSGVASGTTSICVDDALGNILQVTLQFAGGQPKVLKYQRAGDGPGGGAGYFEKPSATTAGRSWVWY